jgi:chemotaxis protein methyltransferase CheR
MKTSEIEQLEIELLLKALAQRYGYDFLSYSRAHIERRIHHFLKQTSLNRVSDLVPAVLWDEQLAARLIGDFSITVTSMFRDPEFYQQLRQHLIPVLRTYPFIKIWHAGCATGEEVYTTAILLAEEGLADRATIYGTDFNDEALRQAREGVYDASKAREFSQNYHRAGGRASFSDYYHAKYGYIALTAELKRNVLFANHNLVTDEVFGEMHVVFCRNVLIYFSQQLQDRALELFSESLVRGGFLCLGLKESLKFSVLGSRFQEASPGAKIFKKKPMIAKNEQLGGPP